MSGKGKAIKIPVGGGRRKGTLKVSASSKAGLLFPVARTARLLKEGRYARRVGAKAGVFMAAMLEYLTAEVLEAAGSVAREQNRSRINPRHLQLAIRDDDEMSAFMGNVTLPHGGVVPNIHEALLKSNKKSPSSKSGGSKTAGSGQAAVSSSSPRPTSSGKKPTSAVPKKDKHARKTPASAAVEKEASDDDAMSAGEAEGE